MKQLLVLLALLCTAHARQHDLSEWVFIFPVISDIVNVRLTASAQQPLRALTLCMRFHSTETRSQALFSLALPSQSKAVLLSKPSVGVYRLHINGSHVDITGLPDDTDEWNSVCWTWDSYTGLTTLWVNGKRSARKVLSPKATLTGVPSIILSQAQDTYGRISDRSQSFVGDMTDVHLWNSVISPCEIRFYMEGNAFTPGNLLSWKNLMFSTTGNVLVDRSDFDKVNCY